MYTSFTCVDNMIVRDLNFLLKKEYKEATLNIYENKDLSLVFVENKGYSLYISENGERKDTFLIKSDHSLSELNQIENAEEKNSFIDLIQLFLNKIYDGMDIPDFDKEHREYVFLKFVDLFEKNEVEIIDASSELYNAINNGFTRLDIEILLLNSK